MEQIGIIGNEGCDADSIVCALAYSKFKSACCDCNENPDEQKQTFTPFFQCDNVETRLDFVSVCEQAGITKEEYIKFVNPLNTYKKGEIKKWVFVDHHYPTKLFRKTVGDEEVVEVIDHHMAIADEEKAVVEDLKRKGKIENKKVGSCATLVAKRFMRCLMTKQDVKPSLLPFMKMLLFTILIDTSNLTNSQKTTEEDQQMADALKKETGVTDEDIGTENSGGIYNKLLDSKFSPSFWNAQPLKVILSYDYKSGYKVKLSDTEVEYGMASVLRNIEDSELNAIMAYYQGELKLNAFAINTTTPQNMKQLILFNFPEIVAEKLMSISDELKKKKELGEELTDNDKKMIIFDEMVQTDVNGVVRLLAPDTFSRKAFIEQMGLIQPSFQSIKKEAEIIKVEEASPQPSFSFRSRKAQSTRKTRKAKNGKVVKKAKKSVSKKAKKAISTRKPRAVRSRKSKQKTVVSKQSKRTGRSVIITRSHKK